MKIFSSSILVTSAIFAATPAFAEIESGPRIEVLVGYDNVSLDLSDFDFGKMSENGVAYGASFGYDYALSPNAAIGLDVEYADSSTKVEVELDPAYARISTGRDLYVGARATFAVSDTLNLYAKAGYTNARIKGSAGDGTTTISESDNGDGIRGGVGAQMNFGKAYVLAEYRYSNYEFGFSRNQAMLGLGARF